MSTNASASPPSSKLSSAAVSPPSSNISNVLASPASCSRTCWHPKGPKRGAGTCWRKPEGAPDIGGAVQFSPVMVYPPGATPVALDLSGPNASSFEDYTYTIGKYNEKRGIYTQSLFNDRDIHVGIDLGAPVGHEVFLPYPGVVLYQGYNSEPGDYGHVVITQHELPDKTLYMLFGHLDHASIKHQVGVLLPAGYCIGHLGDSSENGGWPPHLHYQLSRIIPTTHDLPGVVSESHRNQALVDYPDPRLVLGDIY